MKRTPADRLATEGVAHFAAGNSAGALILLVEAFALGVSNPDAVEVFLSVARGTPHEQSALDAAERFLNHPDIDIAPGVRARLGADWLGAADPNVLSEARYLEMILATLQAAAAAGEAGWSRFDQPAVRDRLMERLSSSFTGLEIAEQLLYAPPATGWPAIALQRIESIGVSSQGEPALARAAERLLHACNEPAAAYRVERVRRSRQSREALPSSHDSQPGEPFLRGVTVAVCGGHPALRANVSRQIGALGGATREIPSRFEAVRRDKDISDTLRGSDIAVIITPQIAHSTSDQVRRAAGKLQVLVAPVHSASAAAIVATVVQWRAKMEQM